MVFPLLGILGLAATAALKPRYDDWVNDRRGRSADDALAGAGGGFDEQARALLGRGLVTPDQYLGAIGDAEQRGIQAGNLDVNRGQLDLMRERLGFDREATARDDAYRMLGKFQGNPIIGDISPEILGAAKESIASIESGNAKDPYRVLGPVLPSGDRAFGKYQVMGNNIPAWTQEALGRRMTPDEFLADDAAQEAVADHFIGRSLANNRTIEDTASEWFTGKTLAEAMRENNRGDGFTSVPGYVGRVSTGFNARIAGLEQQRAKAAERRALVVKGDEAAGPYETTATRADTVLQGLDQFSRVGSIADDTRAKATYDQVRKNAEEVFTDWRKSVYGEAEPSEASQARFREMFPEPGGSTFENRERTRRYFDTIRAESAKMAEYQRAKLAYEAGLISYDDLRTLNQGRLTREEREEINSGTSGAPPGFKEVMSVPLGLPAPERRNPSGSGLPIGVSGRIQ